MVLKTLLLIFGLLLPATAWAQMAPIPVTSAIYGAKCDGNADDGPAINAAATSAVNSGVYAIALPGGQPCHSTSVTIDIPNGVAIHSFGYGGSQTPAIGAVIQCALSTPTICVQTHDNSADGTHTLGGQTIKGLTITRDEGTIVSGTEGLRINPGMGITLEDVMVNRQDILYHLKGNGSQGLYFNANRIKGCAWTNTAFLYDYWAGARIDQPLFGCNGSSDLAGSQSYVTITGGSGGAGPNTLVFNDFHWNVGTVAASPACAIKFANLNSASGNTVEFKFLGGHTEGFNALLCSDSTLTSLTQFLMANSTWQPDQTIEWLNLNATTKVNFSKFIGNDFNGNFGTSTFTLSGANCWFNTLFQGNHWMGLEVFANGGSATCWNTTYGTRLDMADNSFWANSSPALVVAGAYDSGKFGGTLAGGQSVSCTATGPVQMTFAGAGVALCSWTPTLLINGSSAGITQSVTRGSWQLDGDDMKAWFFITLSAVSGSGNVIISGLPNPCSSTIGAAGSGVGSYANGAGLRGGLIAVPNAGASTILLKTAGAAASVPLTQANLTATTTVQGYINCPL